MKKKKLKKIFFGIILFLGGLLISGILLFLYEEKKYKNYSPRNFWIGSHNFSRLPLNQFEKGVKNNLNKNSQKFSIQIKDVSREYSYEDFFGQMNFSELEFFLKERENASLLPKFIFWVKSFYFKTRFDSSYFFNESHLENRLRYFVKESNLNDLFEGDALIQGFHLEIKYPQDKEYIDYKGEIKKLSEFYFSNKDVFEPSVLRQKSIRTKDDFSNLEKKFNYFIDDPIKLIFSQSGITLFERELSLEEISSLLLVRVPQSPKENPYFDVNASLFNSILEDFYPKDANIYVKSGELIFEHSQSGLDVDVSGTKKNFLDFAKNENKERSVFVVAHRIIQPGKNDSDLAGLSIKEKISSFTTYYSCCKARTENIQRLADLLDNLILEPGESLNINDFIGERTEEKGFKSAATIIKGHLQDSVGGGISQFITTLHNAVYWAGFELIASKPHSMYFSRYPVGVEATINYPYVDYIFKNDTDYGLLIDTEYTDTSITVNLYGFNDGRLFEGEHRYGYTKKDVKSGGEDARKVISKVSKAYDFKDPRIVYKKDPSVSKGELKHVQDGLPGWSVDVERYVYQGGELIHYNDSKVNYLGSKDTVYSTHYCPTLDKTNICK